MKRIRCPKCDEPILFDDALYVPGRTLVFECPCCNKQFKIRLPSPKTEAQATETEAAVLGYFVVIENAFHYRQIIPLRLGRNTIGRQVPGTNANAAFKTVDPSVDTTHCHVQVQQKAGGAVRFILRDGPSGTGTFVLDHIVGARETVYLHEGDIVTIGATTLIMHEGAPETDTTTL